MKVKAKSNLKKFLQTTPYAIPIPEIVPEYSGGPQTLQDFFSLIISWILIIAGGLAFIFLIYSGILYITSGGSPEQQKKAQQGLVSAIIGIIIIVLSYIIVIVVQNLARGVF